MKSSFQTIIIGTFLTAFIVAVIAFSGILGGSSGASTSSVPEGEVIIWGVLPSETMQAYVTDFNSNGYGYTIQYEEHSPETFYQDLIMALANNGSPDVVMYSSEIFSQFKDKLYTIPYQAYTERTFRDTNVDGAQVFLTKDGVLGLPIVVDPMVVYYNKDILAAQNFVVPPRNWNTLARSVPLLTKRTAQNTLAQSAVALGEVDNVMHFRDILSTLFLQTGSSIVGIDPVTGVALSTLTNGGSLDGGTLPTADALTFYTGFANPTSGSYSWNRTLPNSLQQFLSGKTAFYIGRASELFGIQDQNPNLNFDVMEMFQPENATRSITYGSFVAVGVMKAAPNFTAAYAAVSTMASAEGVDALSKRFSLPPVRRDLLLVAQQNPYLSVFFKAALSAFTWPDPNIATTNRLFRAMIQDVNSGKSNAQTAIYEAARDFQTSN
ncbi:extracellular solute-binding protein [Patescibacteria group bacterium]|nr:extracellular solute-binding protein [Patescibacteria group bacterium]